MTTHRNSRTNFRTTLLCSCTLVVSGLSGTAQAAEPSVTEIDEQSYPSASIQTLDLASIDTTNGLSVSLCVNPQNPSTTDNEVRYISQATGIFSNQHNLMVGSKGGKMRARLMTDSGNTVTVLSDSDVIEQNEWNHLVMTYDNSVLTLYHNNTVVQTETIPGMAMLDSETTTALGSQPQGADRDDGKMRNLNGSLSHVKVYQEALTSDEVENLGADCVESIPQTQCPAPFNDLIIENKGISFLLPVTLTIMQTTRAVGNYRYSSSCRFGNSPDPSIDFSYLVVDFEVGLDGTELQPIEESTLSIPTRDILITEPTTSQQARACGVLLGCNSFNSQP